MIRSNKGLVPCNQHFTGPIMISFDNSYTKLPPHFYQSVEAEHFSNPTLITFNSELAQQLKIDYQQMSEHELASIFSGQKKLDGSSSIALAYAGHQFGHPNPQLGDGRALLLGETQGHDIQLKGSGQTPFSRRGDGKSALGPVLREYLLSEAMNTLGVPTTRALAAVSTGEKVYRQNGAEPGGVFTRVAKSHLRVGSFEYFAFKRDLKALKALLDYTIERHYPWLKDVRSNKEKSLNLLKELIEKQADLIAKWSGLGFIHGVMNTDNFSLAGLTIDYGPCAFMDEFRFHKVFSSIDQHGRYSFFNQVPIAQWNILRLADCLIDFIDEDEKVALRTLESELAAPMVSFEKKRIQAFERKLGLNESSQQTEKLVMDFLNYLEKESLDFTLAFRYLPDLFHDRTTFYPRTSQGEQFLFQWRELNPTLDQLDSINPLYIPRNHQVQKAIDQAYQGNLSHFHQLLQAWKNPYQEQKALEHLTLPPKPHERVYQTFCGT